MDFGFDLGVERRGTNCIKWDDPHVDPDVVCMGVADMDFEVPPAVKASLLEKVQHGAFGYGIFGDEDWQAVLDWRREVHGQSLKREWLLYSPGVIATLHAAIRAITKPGDKVIIETPVYPPFFGAIRGEDREVVEAPLIKRDGKWYRNPERMEELLKEGASCIFICSPHNPAGRVWTREEQQMVADLAVKYDVPVLCDEIHSDLVMPGFTHTPIMDLPGMTERTVTAFSPTKTFNLAGLKISTAVCPREDWREAMSKALYSCGSHSPNVLAQAAQLAAYREGRPWLEALKPYIAENGRLLVNALNECGFPTAPLEGTYLVVADMSRLGFGKDEQALNRFLVEKARIFSNSCGAFGMPEGARFNLATPRFNVGKAIEGLRKL